MIISGGISKERLISLDTGKQVAKELKKNGYQIKISEPNFSLLDTIKSFKPNIIFNALHGQFGEDGYIQTILETTNIPYTHSGVISSAIAMDKELSKKIFIKNKILTPKYFLYSFNETKFKLIKKIEKKLKFPVVIKPINEGSSVNVFICTKLNILKNLKFLKEYKKIIIEEFIPGREIQAAIIGKQKLGAIELKPKRKFYDYQAKYNPKAKTEHIIPVNLSKEKYNTLMNIALKTHKLIGCKGVTRSDFKYYNKKFYLLEINTQPGMTKLSLVPEIAAYQGISFIKLIKLILKDASRQISKKIFLYLFLFILLTTLSNKNFINFQFPNINQIDILGFDQRENNELSKDLEFLKSENLFFLNKEKIIKILNSNNLIERATIYLKNFHPH